MCGQKIVVNFSFKLEICSFHESYTTSDPVQYNWRRESFNEDYLRGGGRSTPTGILQDSDRRMSLQEGEDAGSPFVSMPAIPAVYLAVDGEGPLEKVTYFIFNLTCTYIQSIMFFTNSSSLHKKLKFIGLYGTKFSKTFSL